MFIYHHPSSMTDSMDIYLSESYTVFTLTIVTSRTSHLYVLSIYHLFIWPHNQTLRPLPHESLSKLKTSKSKSSQ